MEPKKYKLTRLEPLLPNVQAELAGFVVTGVEFTPGPGKKYIFSVKVGDVPPKQAMAHIETARRALNELMPDRSTLIIPTRDGHPVIGIYELEEVP